MWTLTFIDVAGKYGPNAWNTNSTKDFERYESVIWCGYPDFLQDIFWRLKQNKKVLVFCGIFTEIYSKNVNTINDFFNSIVKAEVIVHKSRSELSWILWNKNSVGYQWCLGKSIPFLGNLYLFGKSIHFYMYVVKNNKGINFPRRHWRSTLYVNCRINNINIPACELWLFMMWKANMVQMLKILLPPEILNAMKSVVCCGFLARLFCCLKQNKNVLVSCNVFTEMCTPFRDVTTGIFKCDCIYKVGRICSCCCNRVKVFENLGAVVPHPSYS